ncbi:type II toxin-antitoxin system CcdA family antitoxin [Paracraurococcus lichenis]|uniref:Type II toxin-antitoxin system CcdA family antitoxin n=1 Tax=Paracraurococcus lichenis TaxID=3064888 RepID=A0ABT9E525_9PROT|nr:type II toxin-antitoxin system CcdA family antitoxin [Paracraurococcus sp. LOR1-02]MDO9711280.1 type II toxin-antitoxin system CcdA family antitoxin [Paracraurococcus sp. LOR1-02]
MSATTRRPTNVSLPEALVAEAKALEVNLSRACEEGLAAAVRTARQRRWQAENREAMESWAEPLAKHGLPLARFRTF